MDFAQIIKLYCGTGDDNATAVARYSPPRCLGFKVNEVTGQPDPKHISTSYVERQKLNLRMAVRRFTRLTTPPAFSKRLENHDHAVTLHVVWHNWCRRNKTPADDANSGGRAHQGVVRRGVAGRADRRSDAGAREAGPETEGSTELTAT